MISRALAQGAALQRNLAFVCSLLLTFSAFYSSARAASAYPATELVRERAASISTSNHWNGWAYVISGGITLGVSIPGYYLSEDVFARAVYSIGQALGVGTVGYGTYLLLIENEYENFQNVLAAAKDLTPTQREQMSYAFLKNNADRAKGVRRLRVITHSLMAGLNILSGSTTSHSDLKTALYFIGGVNLIAAGSFLFGSSEEEDLLNKIPQVGIGPSPQVNLSFRF